MTERWRAAVLGYSLSSSRSIIKGSGTTSGGFTARVGLAQPLDSTGGSVALLPLNTVLSPTVQEKYQ